MARDGGYTGGETTDGDSQVPGPLPENARDRISRTEAFEIQKTPNAVYIGDLAEASDNVAFFFGSSASFATLANTEAGDAGYRLTGSQHYSDFGHPAAGTILNIHPTAFSSSNANSSSIHFIYSSGLRTGPY